MSLTDRGLLSVRNLTEIGRKVNGKVTEVGYEITSGLITGVTGAATLTSSGSIQVTAASLVSGDVQLSSSGSLEATAAVSVNVPVAMSASSGLQADSVIVLSSSTTVSAFGTLQASGELAHNSAADLSAKGNMILDAVNIIRYADIDLTDSGKLSADGVLMLTSDGAAFTGTSKLSADALNLQSIVMKMTSRMMIVEFEVGQNYESRASLKSAGRIELNPVVVACGEANLIGTSDTTVSADKSRLIKLLGSTDLIVELRGRLERTVKVRGSTDQTVRLKGSWKRGEQL